MLEGLCEGATSFLVVLDAADVFLEPKKMLNQLNQYVTDQVLQRACGILFLV